MISEGWRDTEDWSNDAEKLALDYIGKYFLIVMLFHNITVFTVFLLTPNNWTVCMYNVCMQVLMIVIYLKPCLFWLICNIIKMYNTIDTIVLKDMAGYIHRGFILALCLIFQVLRLLLLFTLQSRRKLTGLLKDSVSSHVDPESCSSSFLLKMLLLAPWFSATEMKLCWKNWRFVQC